MVDMSAPIEFSFVLETVGILFVIIGVCVYLVRIKTKKLKSMNKDENL